MNEDQLQALAAHLCKPDGETGMQVASHMNTGNGLINRLALARLQASPNDNILEIGMGNGYFVKDIHSVSPSIRYTGCDYSVTMIEAARALNEEYVQNGQAQFLLADAKSLPFGDGTFNKAFAVNVLYFWKNPDENLQEIRRVLKPDAKLIIAIRPKRRMEEYPFTQYSFTLYAKEDAVELLERNGFTVTDIYEEQEPDQELMGMKRKVESLIVVGQRRDGQNQ